MGNRKNRLKLNPDRILRVVTKVVQLAEMIFPEAKTGAQKKEMAIRILQGSIDIPILGTQAEGQIWSVLIDLVVAGFNQAEGKWGGGN